jgi:PAS domain S-box-containing protein
MPAPDTAPVGPSGASTDTDTTAPERAAVSVPMGDGDDWVRFALAAARVGVWELDLRSDALKWSSTAAIAFGLGPESAPTSGRAFIEIVHPEDRPALASNHERAIRDRLDVVSEFRTIAADGGVRWMQAHGRVTYDHTGTALRMLGVNIDISDRKVLEQQLLVANSQVERLRILKATMRTVQDIVSNALMNLQFLHLEADPPVSAEALALLDRIIAETTGKLNALADVDRVVETKMVAGTGISYGSLESERG